MELEITRIFIKVVQQASFSKAALILKLPKSTVSRAVSRLEKETGTKLLLRTTRSLSLTKEGQAFYNVCSQPIHILEDAYKFLQGRDHILTGNIRMTVVEDLGTQIVAPAVAKLVKENPGLTFELNFTEDIKDLVKDGYDFAFRIGKINISSFKVKKVGEIILVLVASPSYLKAKNIIKSPQELSKHECLAFNSQALSKRFVLQNKKETVQIVIKPRIICNQMTTLLKIALEGAGIAFVPLFLCKSEIITGRLIRVLPGWNSSVLPVSIISPLASNSSARLKLTLDSLALEIKNVLLEKEAL